MTVIVNAPDGRSISLDNQMPFVLMAGLNVLESYELAHQVAEHCVAVCQRLGIPFVFKASFDKANRSSIHSFRGPGIETGLQWLSDIKSRFNVPVLTDVHEPWQVDLAKSVVDILQLPAFLCRQTDLVAALAKTDAVVNVKKAQFLSPAEVKHIVDKFAELGHSKLLLCERGSSFGYHNLVVDMLSFSVMKAWGLPVVFDVTHALQQPGALPNATGGRRHQLLPLALAGVSQGLAGVFLEVHPDPGKAKCDGPCALKLNQLEAVLQQLQAIDSLVKTFPSLDTA